MGATIHPGPGEAPIRDGVVLVRDGRIVAVGGGRPVVEVPPAARVIDCAGLTLTAGSWNSHAHFFERKWANAATIPSDELARQLREMLTRYGFTSVFDIGSPWANTRLIRDRIESGEVPGPRILSTGDALVAPGAVPPDAILRALGFMTSRGLEVADAAQAASAARAQLEAGVDGIKLHLQPPPPPAAPIPGDAVRAAVDVAHRAGKPVFLHPSSAADVLAAARAGVDVLAHTTPRESPWDAATLGALIARRVALTPTLTLWRHALRHDRVSDQERTAAAGVDQLRAWVAAGGTVLYGNDLGAVPYDPAEEYALMAEAGMSFAQVLASLTTAPAERFGASDRLGRIAPGFEGDLVALRGDPGQYLRALTAVRYAFRAGAIVYQEPE